ncbi:MAG: tyrosine-type recombinase/integrase [Alphaproteobacteria bacterium]|nr:tyrosine-type recombinase/integrase [Alphaproteobacteria bacterium]
MPRRTRLTDAGIARMRPEAREYTVWDMGVAGLGLRVRPSGSRTFIYHRRTPRGVKKMSFGPAELRKVEDVRRDCLAAASGAVETDGAVKGGRKPAPLLRNFVAGPWKEACLDRCKPSTERTYGSLLKGALLPAFGARRLDRITRGMVLGWFESYSRTAPRNANKALALLRQILNHAIACGHIGTNPARGIAHNPDRKLTRFLSREEIARLHGVLDRHAGGSASEAQQADIIRLLLLTGCRKSEIVRLRRDEAKGDRLELRDSKTGPRAVWLNGPARQIVERRLRQGNGPWVFPSPLDPARPRCPDLLLWYRARREAGIEDVRLHDLRHTVASQAAINGVPLPTVARLLGHANVRMTMRYAHVGDREVEAAAERVGEAIDAIMSRERNDRYEGGGSMNLPDKPR